MTEVVTVGNQDGPAQMNDLSNRPLTSWVERAFKSPAVGMVGWAASVLGFLLAFYFYFAARETPDLTYFIRPNRTAVVAVGDTPGISITYKGRELNKNVSAAQIVIWNAGKKPIRHEDVLTPFVVSIQGRHPIVTAKIIEVTNPVTEFRLIDTNFQSGQLPIDWRVLEHNDGAIVQLLYEGDISVPILLSGISIGQRTVTLRTQTEGFKTYKERSSWGNWLFYMGAGLNALILLFMFAAIYVTGNEFSTQRWREIRTTQWVWFAARILIAAGVFGLLVVRYANVWNPSPFGY
jgi:hypothetical protein